MSKVKNRLLVSELIIKVLTQKLCVRDALLMFPKNNIDPSIQVAWHALIHYEADEEMRYMDIEFKEEQDDFLYFLSNLLRQNQDIPKNILDDYNEWHGGTPIRVEEKTLWGKIIALLRFIT